MRATAAACAALAGGTVRYLPEREVAGSPAVDDAAGPRHVPLPSEIAHERASHSPRAARGGLVVARSSPRASPSAPAYVAPGRPAHRPALIRRRRASRSMSLGLFGGAAAAGRHGAAAGCRRSSTSASTRSTPRPTRAGCCRPQVVDNNAGHGSFTGALPRRHRCRANRPGSMPAIRRSASSTSRCSAPARAPVTGQRGVANAHGSRGVNAQCEYVLTGPGLGHRRVPVLRRRLLPDALRRLIRDRARPALTSAPARGGPARRRGGARVIRCPRLAGFGAAGPASAGSRRRCSSRSRPGGPLSSSSSAR